MSALDRVKQWLQSCLKRPRPVPPPEPPPELVERYRQYKRLLGANNAILSILADLQDKRQKEFLFDMHYVRSTVGRLEEEAQALVTALAAMSGGKYAPLETALRQVMAKIAQELAEPRLKPGPLVLPLSEVREGWFFGGKAEKLGDLIRLGMPVPPGFAISAYAQKLFFEHSGLEEFIRQTLGGEGLKSLEDFTAAGAAIRERLLAAPLPAALSEALHQHLESLGADRLAVRSSALQEDSYFSFAGQFESILNVPPAEVEQRYKEVVASCFTPRALYYCQTKGFSYQDLAMGVVVMKMVAAKAAGVLYTADPREGRKATIVNAVCGLGSLAVGGQVAPDIYRLEDNRLVARQIGAKERMQVPAAKGGVTETPTPAELSGLCLSEAEVMELASLGTKVEEVFGQPQDIEWALDSRGTFYLLQARPLRLKTLEKRESLPPIIKEAKVLMHQGAIASRGAAAGRVYLLEDDDLQAVPEGAVLVSKRALPELGAVADKVAAMVCEAGSVTSHLATVLRESGVPAIFGARGATQVLIPETEVTVDALYGNIYEGRVEELLKAGAKAAPARQSRAWETLERVLQHITPLNLLDPRAANFRPEACTTLHDITRFAHEKAMSEMFRISDVSQDTNARRLVSNIPLEVFLIDLGGGLKPEALNRLEVRPEDILSRPMAAYWRGVSAVGWKGPKPVDLKGLMSVMLGTGAGENIQQRLEEKNYAIIAAEYLNLAKRLGFHFATIESYLNGPEDSYVSLTFYGGGAALARRARRVRFLAKVLNHVEFRVELKEDSLFARADGYDPGILEEKLDILGRLMMVSKQMDMVMFSDAMVDHYYREFIEEGYNLRL
ncbi:MAG: PEP/pyruvate-binding domain-containing protein [Desulfobaccales bacterium]